MSCFSTFMLMAVYFCLICFKSHSLILRPYYLGPSHFYCVILYMLWPFVCLSAQVIVLLKQLNITQTTPHDSPGSLVF